MDLQQIKELALLMQQTGLTSLHLTEGAVNIQMERAGTAAAVCAQPIPVSYTHLDVYKRQAWTPWTC